MLDIAQRELGWPDSNMIFSPPGSGAAVIANLAKTKIQQRINLLDGGQHARIGVLTVDPSSSSTQAPVALVCEFNKNIPISTLQELHRLAWNFSRSPLLITIEPNRLRAFSCCEQPKMEQQFDGSALSAELVEAEYQKGHFSSKINKKAISVLHWLNLSAGVLQRRYPERFDRRYTADNTLLENLNVVREKLNENGLPFDLIHDLLARLIFIQFLFQRCDSNGRAALNDSQLKKLHQAGVLLQHHKSLAGILESREDTYAFFQYLNERFNGDLFTGKSDSEAEREGEWLKEMGQVQDKHLQLLRSFITGEMQISSGQLALWPLYSFDAIPLEFISSIYEAFVTKRTGTVYTPVHLVDFVLDGVLPWEGTVWDLKILDPACGSGIFLVRAFQRLAHCWKNANPGKQLRTETLRRLLTHNLTGVDIDPHAIRVASFSLYLAMCDELDPRHYWQHIRFPKLREDRLICADFFSEEIKSINTELSAKNYDLVVGNPPWGKNQVKDVLQEFGSDAANEWSKKHSWPISYGDPGTLFVAKSLRLTKPDGFVSLLQPTQTLLLNQSGPAVDLRHKLFNDHQVIEVVNLSSLRFGLFKKAVGPSSIITVKPNLAESDYTVSYIVIKPSTTSDNDYRFVINPYDTHEVYASEMFKKPLIWISLTWGGARDLALLEYVSRFPNIADYKSLGKLKTRSGVIRGNKGKSEPYIVGKRLFSNRDFPGDNLVHLDPKYAEENINPHIHSCDSTDFTAFEPPQFLIKKSFRKETGRFRAARILNDNEGILCSDSYVTVSASDGGDKELLDSTCATLNSRFATYYLLLTSAPFSNYRATTKVRELLSIPCPKSLPLKLKNIVNYQDVDEAVNDGFGLKESEKILIDDLFDVVLPYFKGGENSIARQHTKRINYQEADTELTSYLEWFLRVLKATFGESSHICSTLFEESGEEKLPIRLVAIHLNWPGQSPIAIEKLSEGDLSTKLTDLYAHLSGELSNGPTCYQRVARIFDTIQVGDHSVPTIFIAKPDEKHFWTRSIAMRDADEVASEAMLSRSSYEKDNV